MKRQSQDPALQDRRSQPLGPAGLGRFHLGLPVSEARVRMETRKVEDALFKVGLGSCSPGFLPGLQAREGSVYVEVAPGNSCVSVCGCVCTAAHGPPWEDHFVTGEPCARDPLSAHLHVIPRKETRHGCMSSVVSVSHGATSAPPPAPCPHTHCPTLLYHPGL